MIFGWTRYSVFNPDAKSWRASSKLTPEKYKRHLFDPKRLEVRQELFLNYSLPIIVKNLRSFGSYFHLVEYSSELPEPFKSNLISACNESHERIILIKFGERNKVIRKIASKIFCHKDPEPLMTFKLDDDDVLSEDFITCLSKYHLPDFIGTVISFASGVMGYFDPDEKKFKMFKESYFPKLNIGLAGIGSCEKDGVGNVSVNFLNPGSHMSTDFRYPVVLDSREPMYIWTRTGVQDTAVSKEEFVEEVFLKMTTMKDVAPHVLERFGL